MRGSRRRRSDIGTAALITRRGALSWPVGKNMTPRLHTDTILSPSADPPYCWRDDMISPATFDIDDTTTPSRCRACRVSRLIPSAAARRDMARQQPRDEPRRRAADGSSARRSTWAGAADNVSPQPRAYLHRAFLDEFPMMMLDTAAYITTCILGRRYFARFRPRFYARRSCYRAASLAYSPLSFRYRK